MKHPKYSRSFEVVSELPEVLRPLQALAANFRWTWDHEAREVFRLVDKEMWEQVHHNPIQMIARLSAERITRLEKDAAFLERLHKAKESLDDYLSGHTWFDGAYPDLRNQLKIAYFCAEFGVSESLPIYSGGLGVLAGDHVKAASDLGLPLVGVGLLYSRGYFRQQLSHDGWQQEIYPQYDFYQLPLHLVRGADERPLRIEVELPDRLVTCQIWKAMVGRVPLYLLDSNVLENAPFDQGITDTLYGGDEEMRIRQEMILGIGGMRALKAVGVQPTVCHMNEGHAAFLSIERIRQFMVEHGCDWRTARQAIVAGNVFTTHTPVPAGFDVFAPDLLSRYMAKTAEAAGLTMPDLLRLGRIDPENEGEPFNMAVLAMENANHVNGVSKLHAQVTRGMFQGRWPGFPEDEVPIQPVTNGIHTSTWTSRRMSELFDEYLGADWRRNTADEEVWRRVDSIPDEEIWSIREDQRNELVRFVRGRLQRDLERRNVGRPDFAMIGGILDPRILTIGFARRFATYKRATLMLREPERLLNLLYHAERPIQIVIAGKSHPRDDGGKRMIQELVRFINEGGARTRMVFLEDYDMQVARALVQGVDLWLNNPLRPFEASGTSGMKVVPNGGINCSVLDGWWDEGYDPSVGFSIGERQTSPDTSHQDWLDSRALYSVLESEVTPRFYNRGDRGVPREWVALIKRSIRTLAPRFSTSRMVQEYAETAYVPANLAYGRLCENGLGGARDALAWRDRIRRAWPKVRIVSVRDTAKLTNALGGQFDVVAEVELGDLSPDDVVVQALAGRIGPNRDLLDARPYELEAKSPSGGAYEFSGTVEFSEPGHRGYTVRVVPRHSVVNVLNELPLIAWQPS